MAKKPTLETVTTSIARWQTRLRRAVRAIEKLERQRKRLETKAKSAVQLPSAARATAQKADTPHHQPAAHPTEIDTGIPTFLQRKKLDPVAEQIKAEQEATKKAKARGRIERMKAKRSGDLKKMPLTGKAALAAIRA